MYIYSLFKFSLLYVRIMLHKNEQIIDYKNFKKKLKLNN